MKKLLQLIIIGSIIQLFFVQVEAQTADITKACAPIKIKFTAPTGFNSWYWDFKDGVTSDLATPEHVFTEAGNYIVEFKENINSTVIGSLLIVILAKPDIKVNVSPEKGCVQLEVSFSDATNYSPDILVSARNWVFGDGAFSNGNFLKHSYQKAGQFDLSLEIKTNLAGCDLTQIFKDKIEVYSLPEPVIVTDPNPAASCLFPFEVNFTEKSKGSGPFKYNWSFGNGNSSNVSAPDKQTYNNSGSYQVSLKIEDVNGCMSTANTNVLVGLAKINVKFPDTVCLDNTFIFDNKSGIGNHKWDFGPNSLPETSTERSPGVSFDTPGWKYIHYTLTTGNGMCVSDTIFKVYVLDINTAFPIDYDQDDCKSPITFQFNYTGPLDSIDCIIYK
jgi:PKD repeat protein